MSDGIAAGASGVSASDVLERVLAAYLDLASLGEQIADEWQYVNDLVAVHTADLRSVVEADPARQLWPAAVGAVELAIEEIRLIVDPHRAIDWLSTFPQIVRIPLSPPVAPSPVADA